MTSNVWNLIDDKRKSPEKIQIYSKLRSWPLYEHKENNKKDVLCQILLEIKELNGRVKRIEDLLMMKTVEKHL